MEWLVREDGGRHLLELELVSEEKERFTVVQHEATSLYWGE